MANKLADAELFRHIWKLYQSTIDGRQKHGDLELLAEAAERMVWPGAPEIGPAIAAILRDLRAKNKSTWASKHYRNVRDKEIARLAQDHLREGITATESQRRWAEIYKMTPDGVRKVIERTREDKDAEK